jgi:hypothetical protein
VWQTQLLAVAVAALVMLCYVPLFPWLVPIRDALPKPDRPDVALPAQAFAIGIAAIVSPFFSWLNVLDLRSAARDPAARHREGPSILGLVLLGGVVGRWITQLAGAISISVPALGLLGISLVVVYVAYGAVLRGYYLRADLV